MLHRNSHFSLCPCRAHMPRPDICPRCCRCRCCCCRVERSPSSSSSFLAPLSLALSHSCHAARTSNNSTALRGKATSRRPSPAFSFSRILLSPLPPCACANVRSSRSRFPVPGSCSCSCFRSFPVNFFEPDARPPPFIPPSVIPRETLPRSATVSSTPSGRQVRDHRERRPVLCEQHCRPRIVSLRRTLRSRYPSVSNIIRRSCPPDGLSMVTSVLVTVSFPCTRSR